MLQYKYLAIATANSHARNVLGRREERAAHLMHISCQNISSVTAHHTSAWLCVEDETLWFIALKMFAKCLHCLVSFQSGILLLAYIAHYARLIIFSWFFIDTLKICILLIFLWIRWVSALPQHSVMNSHSQLLVTMAILHRRYRNRLMLSSSPFVPRICSLRLSPSLFLNKTATKRDGESFRESKQRLFY